MTELTLFEKFLIFKEKNDFKIKKSKPTHPLALGCTPKRRTHNSFLK